MWSKKPARCANRSRIEGDHHSGACLDVGGVGEWDRLFVGWPVVINHKEEEFRMYYHALDPDTKKFRVGEENCGYRVCLENSKGTS